MTGMARAMGFTIVEILLSMVLGLMVMGAIFTVFMSQTRQQGLHLETMDARETLRGAAALLSGELRQVSSTDGDVFAIAVTSVVLRSLQGTGIVCVKHAAQPRYGLWATSGDMQATANDTAMVYAAGDTGSAAAKWTVMKIQQVTATPASLGVGTCAWTGGVAAELGLEVVVAAASDTAGVEVGAPVRAFRRVEYGAFQQDGRWWLGRKVGGAGSFELVTGPLRPPADSGLVFHYYDSTGAETANPLLVHRVEIELRSQSFGQAHSSTGIGERLDSLIISAFLRN